MSLKTKKILSYILLTIGFIINFVAITFLMIPMFSDTSNSSINYTNTGMLIFFLAAIFLLIGFILLIKSNKE